MLYHCRVPSTQNRWPVFLTWSHVIEVTSRLKMFRSPVVLRLNNVPCKKKHRTFDAANQRYPCRASRCFSASVAVQSREPLRQQAPCLKSFTTQTYFYLATHCNIFVRSCKSHLRFILISIDCCTWTWRVFLNDDTSAYHWTCAVRYVFINIFLLRNNHLFNAYRFGNFYFQFVMRSYFNF